MAYSELIKSFHRIRAYLRSFYVYGFRHRREFDQKSARSYDNERRRVESWLGEYMSFGQDADGRRFFLSVDSRSIPENPLYRAFRAKSFTDWDITLHFHLLDILRADEALRIAEVMDELDRRLASFERAALPDESTVRKKLKEYHNLGLIRTEKRGRETLYRRSEDHVSLERWDAAAAFFSEAAPLGVIGSYLGDRLARRVPWFRFKHHYILNALDSEVLLTLFTAIRERKRVRFRTARGLFTVVPLKVYIGTQTGRQYLLAWTPRQHFAFYRADLMDSVTLGEAFEAPEDLAQRLETFQAHCWGVTGSGSGPLQRVEMTVHVGPGEGFLVERLEREKRCGQVEQVDETHWRFTAEVWDALELLPWLRTFTGRVSALSCTDERVTQRFWEDFDALAELYGGETDALS